MAEAEKSNTENNEEIVIDKVALEEAITSLVPPEYIKSIQDRVFVILCDPKSGTCTIKSIKEGLEASGASNLAQKLIEILQSPAMNPIKGSVKEENEEINIEILFIRINEVQATFRNLPTSCARKGITLPEDFDHERNGGYAELSINGRSQDLRKIAEISYIEEISNDPTMPYTTKDEKFKIYAHEKNQALIFQSNSLLSEDTIFPVRGGVKVIDKKGNIIIFSYSGDTPLSDQAMVIAALYKAGKINDDILERIKMRVENPYLEPEIFNLLIR